MSMTYSESVRLKLMATGATQMEIATATGAKQTTISRFLRGENSRVELVERLEKFADDHKRLAKLKEGKAA